MYCLKSKLLSAPFDQIKLFHDVDSRWLGLKKIILDSIDEIAPFKLISIKSNSLPWFDTELKNKFKFRNYIRALAISILDDRSSDIWVKLRKVRNECKSLLRKKMVAFFADKTPKAMQNSKKFWNLYKSVIKTKKEFQALLSSLLKLIKAI